MGRWKLEKMSRNSGGGSGREMVRSTRAEGVRPHALGSPYAPERPTRLRDMGAEVMCWLTCLSIACRSEMGDPLEDSSSVRTRACMLPLSAVAASPRLPRGRRAAARAESRQQEGQGQERKGGHVLPRPYWKSFASYEARNFRASRSYVEQVWLPRRKVWVKALLSVIQAGPARMGKRGNHRTWTCV